MNKLLGIALLAALFSCTGCFTAAPPDVARLNAEPLGTAKASPPQVNAEQVTAQNARRMAQTLREEIDRDAVEER
jgi:hypothetical protein